MKNMNLIDSEQIITSIKEKESMSELHQSYDYECNECEYIYNTEDNMW